MKEREKEKDIGARRVTWRECWRTTTAVRRTFWMKPS